MSSLELSSPSNNEQSHLPPAGFLAETVMNTMMQMYHRAKKQYFSPINLATKEVQVVEGTAAGAKITLTIWVGRSSRHGMEEVCCRVKVLPQIGFDGTHFENEFLLHSLLLFSDMTVKSDRDGIYYVW